MLITKGNLLPGNKDVEVQFYKIQWRWWWDNSGDNLSNFTQDKYNKLIKKETVHLNNGTGKWSFNVGENEWGRYLVLVKDLRAGIQPGMLFILMSPAGKAARIRTILLQHLCYPLHQIKKNIISVMK